MSLINHIGLISNQDNQRHHLYTASQNCLCSAVIAAVNDGTYAATVNIGSIVILANYNIFNIAGCFYLSSGQTITYGNGKYDLYVYSL